VKPYTPRCGLTADAQALIAALREEIISVGWSATARQAGLNRCSLHRAFRATPGQSVPNFDTIMAVANALGLELTVRRKPE
jgi:probable addiction module antidote protein